VRWVNLQGWFTDASLTHLRTVAAHNTGEGDMPPLEPSRFDPSGTRASFRYAPAK
jgi:hypothetical protein